MQRELLGGRRNPVVGRVMELGVKMQALCVVVDQPDRDAHRRVRRKLAQVTNMRFGGEERCAALARVIGAETDEKKRLVDGAVDQHVVISHVEMSVVVDPRGIDGHHGRYERREKYGLEIDTSGHLNWRFGSSLACNDAMRIVFAQARAHLPAGFC